MFKVTVSGNKIKVHALVCGCGSNVFDYCEIQYPVSKFICTMCGKIVLSTAHKYKVSYVQLEVEDTGPLKYVEDYFNETL